MPIRIVRRGIILIAIIFFLVLNLNGENVKKFSSIKVSGLKSIKRSDLLKNIRLKKVSDGVLVDIDSIEKELKNFIEIKSFKIFGEKGILNIIVSEKEYHYYFALKKLKSVVLFEADRNFNLKNINNISNPDMPIIIISRNSIIKNKLSMEVKNFCLLLDKIKKEYVRLYREIEEIHYIDNEKIKIKLFNRKTKFYLKPVEIFFVKLEYVSGYLDRINYYPNDLNINNKILIR